MKMHHTLLSLALALALPFSVWADDSNSAEMAQAREDLAAARAELRDVTKRIAEASAKLGEGGPQAFAFRYLHEPKRAMIGIVMVPDRQGVRIGAVTPGGPAAKAGIRAGDILSSVNAKALTPQTDASKATDQAREWLSDLEAGQSVKLGILRAGKPQEFELKAERRDSWDWAGMLDNIPDLEAGQAPQAKVHGQGEDRQIEIIVDGQRKVISTSEDGAPKVYRFESRDGKSIHRARVDRLIRSDGREAPWASLNLSTINPQLGHYFGTDRGVLVLNSSEATLKELKPGDVIQIVDGQPADSVSGVMRALASKDVGQMVTIEIWRDRKREVITVAAPERDLLFFPAPPPPPAPPAPPASPDSKSAPMAPPAPTPPPPPPPPRLTFVV